MGRACWNTDCLTHGKPKLLEQMLEQNSGMRRLSMDWKCQFSVCFVLRRLWSIWVDVFGFRNETAAWSPAAVPGVPHTQEPFCAVSTLFSKRKLFHSRVSIQFHWETLLNLNKLDITRGNSGSHFELWLVLIPSCLGLCLVIPNYMGRRGSLSE